jgi:hypothetical protein
MLTQATTTAERDAALDMLEQRPARWPVRATLGADTAFNVFDLLTKLRAMCVVPHVAQSTKNRRSAIDGRTAFLPGYAASQRICSSNEMFFASDGPSMRAVPSVNLMRLK